ncbi:MAG: N-acetylglucosamine-6-phosphate deacetylase [Gaiellales bacterium]
MRLEVEAALVDGVLVPGDVEIDDGVVTGVGLPVGDGKGIAAPGFIDLQVNGFAGVDFLDADAGDYETAGEALLETGVTSFLPTFITSSPDVLCEALGVLAQLQGSGPRVLGAHLEGPFISPARLGVHPAAWRRDPDLELLDRLLGAGPVRVMTIAPELPGGPELVDALAAAGVTVSLGHTDATADEARAAFAQGATAVTHLFNAMRPLGHREPGLAGAALTTPAVTVQVIADRVHVADDVLRLVATAAPGRFSLVTDAMAGARMPDGLYRLADVEVTVAGGVARRGDGALAGSVLTMDEAVRNLARLGVALEPALTAATAAPASILGLTDVGRLAVGLPADIVVLDEHLEVSRVLIGGVERVAL